MKKSKTYFIASVEDDKVNEINEIAKKMESLGCTINHIHPVTGIITGSAESGVPLNDLRVKGIKHIERDRDRRHYENVIAVFLYSGIFLFFLLSHTSALAPKIAASDSFNSLKTSLTLF